MKNLKILKYPDKRLRILANSVNKINKKVQEIINNMFYTMYKNQGIGLAATQVNIPLKIIVIGNIKKKQTPMVLINPKIISRRGKTKFQEGCLSVPKKKIFVKRAKYITVSAKNYYGQKKIIQAKSLLSVCIQHEIDHLIGKLLIDYSKKN